MTESENEWKRMKKSDNECQRQLALCYYCRYGCSNGEKLRLFCYMCSVLIYLHSVSSYLYSVSFIFSHIPCGSISYHKYCHAVDIEINWIKKISNTKIQKIEYWIVIRWTHIYFYLRFLSPTFTIHRTLRY